ncbi:hypothetical protein CCR75_005916 [Bremia lactucae]|uniref:HTH psq-type domain-containing protein n=1 Tax=Bremia lactucae TaxID=4779 RepID=A0A976NZM8_BRELC|nr:hypothetical protein CCR75_005916 [Bremia lactucae]
MLQTDLVLKVPLPTLTLRTSVSFTTRVETSHCIHRHFDLVVSFPFQTLCLANRRRSVGSSMNRFRRNTPKSDSSDRDPTFRAPTRDQSQPPRVGALPALAQRHLSTYDEQLSLHHETKADHLEQDGKDTPLFPSKQKKRVRYLCDTDRYNIILRIEKGEKQATLAREYGVTRAAICQIKKNRQEIKSRYDLLIQQTQESQRADQKATICTLTSQRVHEIQSNAVILLLTTLRDRRSDPRTFRRATGRLIRLLLEETLATLRGNAIDGATGSCLSKGLPTDELCGVAVGTEGMPFLKILYQMEPEVSQGSIYVRLESEQQNWPLHQMDLPRDIFQYQVLLFSATITTGYAECQAIETLSRLQVQETRMILVSILCSADSIVVICNKFPSFKCGLNQISPFVCTADVRILTASIDAKVDVKSQMMIPGIGNFIARYSRT